MTSLYVYLDLTRCSVLYIGVSGNVDRRDREHRRLSKWRSKADLTLELPVRSREVGLGLESLLIAHFKPEGNTQHALGPIPDPLKVLHASTRAEDLVDASVFAKKIATELERAAERLTVAAQAAKALIVAAGAETLGEAVS